MTRRPTDSLRLMIVDDMPNGAAFWAGLADAHQCRATPVVGKSVDELYDTIRPLLEGGLPFHGTVLDVGIQQQTDGGIRLWERLAAEGLAPLAGELMVATKFNADDIAAFARQHARGRLCTSYHREHRESAFADFVQDVRGRLAAAQSDAEPAAVPGVSKPVWARLPVDVQLALATVYDQLSGRIEELENRMRRGN